MDSACFSTSLPCLPTVWSLPPRTATLLLSVSHFMFQSPVSGFPAPWPPSLPLCLQPSLLTLWTLESQHAVLSPGVTASPTPAPHHLSAFLSFPSHHTQPSLLPFSSSRFCLPCSFYSPSREDSFLGKRVGERRGLGQNKGRGLPRCGSDRERWVENVGKWDTQTKTLERDHREKD